jgi:outer membrane protein assembly factor BamB
MSLPQTGCVDLNDRTEHRGAMTMLSCRISPATVAYAVKSCAGIALACLGLALLSCDEARADWPDFRGPAGTGQAPAPASGQPLGLPLHWSETNNIRWKTEIPLKGLSTPVVLDGQVWLTTATEDGHDFHALGLEAESGRIRFNEKLFHSEEPESLGNGASMNSYATPSAVLEKGRVYVHFGSFGTACLDTSTGQVLWKREDLRCRHYRGPASSPVLFEKLLILTMDGADLQYHIALDKETGQTVWKTDRSVAWNDEHIAGQMAKDGDLRKAHSTPLIVETSNGLQMLSAGAKAAYGYNPRTGRELWRVQYDDWSSAPRPVYDQGLAFFVTGLSKRRLLAVKTDGKGDVTDTHVAWTLDRNVGIYSSPLLIDGLLYTVAEQTYITCLEPSTGRVIWAERLGGTYAASPIYADGRLYVLSQQGKTSVLKPGRTFECLATNSLSGSFLASPAASGKALYLRSKTHLYRVESDKGKTP